MSEDKHSQENDDYKKQDNEEDIYLTHVNRKNWWRMSKYINEESGENLRNFKYCAGDTGFSYDRFYSPLAKWLVDHIPETIAPNVVSIIDFVD